MDNCERIAPIFCRCRELKDFNQETGEHHPLCRDARLREYCNGNLILVDALAYLRRRQREWRELDAMNLLCAAYFDVDDAIKALEKAGL